MKIGCYSLIICLVLVVMVSAVEAGEMDNVSSRGHNSYYFDVADMDAFCKARNSFLDIHTNLEEVCVVPNVVRRANRSNRGLNDVGSTYDYSATVGYLIIFREKK